MGERRFLTTWGFVTPEPIELEFGTIDYVWHPTQQAKIGSHRKRGVGWGHG